MITPDDRAVLRAGLGPGEPSGSDVLVLEPGRGDALLSAMVRNRCVGLLCASVSAGTVVLPGTVGDRLREAQRQSVAVALALERSLLDVAGLLDDLGVEFRVLKGPALAHTIYPDPGWREFGDIDLLVRGHELPAVVDALQRRGAVRAFPRVGRRYEQHVGKSVTLRLAAGWELDLHRTIAHGPWATLVEVGDLWRRPQVFTLGGRSLPTLDIETHLAQAVVHIGLGSPEPRWNSLRDVAQLNVAAGLERGRVLELLDRWSARIPAGVAAGWAGSATGDDLAWLSAPRPASPTEQRWMDLYRTPDSFRRLSLEALRAPIGWRRRAGHLIALAPLARRRDPTGVSVR